MADVWGEESAGAVGQLVSLAGVKGAPDKGLKVRRPDSSINITTGLEVLQANPRRVWAMVQNCGTAVLYFCFDVNTGVGATFELQMNETLVLNRNLPWTGAVYCAAGTGQVNWMEAEVQT